MPVGSPLFTRLILRVAVLGILACVMAGTGTASAEDRPESTSATSEPPSVVAQDAPPQDGLDGFDDFVARVAAEWHVPGIAVAIIQDGEVVLARGYGFRDLQQQSPVTARTLFPIASVTKPFTATATAILVDDGRLGWDDPVRQHLRAFQLFDDAATEQLTLRDCLSHRTGLAAHGLCWYGRGDWPQRHITPERMYRKLRYLEPTAPARSTYQYSNSGFFIAGEVIRKLGGQPWEKFLRERLLDPLDMQHTNLSIVDLQQSEDFARPHVWLDGEVHERPFFPGQVIGPAGNINSNVRDMARFLQLYLGQGQIDGQRIVSREQMQQLLTPVVPLPCLNGYGELKAFHSMGWQLLSLGGATWARHTGSLPGFTSVVGVAPQHNCGYVVLTNLHVRPTAELIEANIRRRLMQRPAVDEFELYFDLEEASENGYEQARLSRRPPQIPSTACPHPLQDYAGTFTNPAFDEFRVTLTEQSGLQWEWHGFLGPLQHYHYDTFAIEGDARLNGIDDYAVRRELVTFHTDRDGTVRSLSLPIPPTPRDIVFVRTRTE